MLTMLQAWSSLGRKGVFLEETQKISLHNNRGRGGGLVVSTLAFYFNDPSSNPAGYKLIMTEKMKINQFFLQLSLHLTNF